MRQPPTGTVTFLFTDIEGSTRLWEKQPDAMRVALARHDALLRQAIEGHGGWVFKTVGDAFYAAFTDAPDALAGALAAQRALAGEPWGTDTPLRVRMALHTGACDERDGDYYGPPLNRVARLMAAGHGGQTLLSLAARELVRDLLPPDTGMRDLGERRLKDLGRPERVFQLLHPDLDADFPPLCTLDDPALPNNLPPQTTSFIGRDKELAEVRAVLAETRLLTLTGAGGAGKTRLALQAAADLLEGDGDGVWLVELAGLSDPALVPQAVARTLRLREESGGGPREALPALADALRDKRLLLLLDNCEHLIAACASLAAELLRNCPGVHVLATSREALGVAGEQTYRVPSLSLPAPGRAQTAAGLARCEAVRLFVDRARSVQPDFAVSDAAAPAVAQVCARLDGIPLAIELAAARVRALSVEQINTRLDQRFRLLTGGARTALPRQQTLRALIDWSYDLLSESEKMLLRRLSVFAGGWTLEAAEAVCAGDGVEDWEVLDRLTALVDKSLAVAEPAGNGMRFRLLESIREYAGDRLEEQDEADPARSGHLSWGMALAEEALPRLLGPDQGAWLARLEAEHDNLRASLAWAGGPGQTGTPAPEQGLRLAGALAWFWFLRGHWSEGRRQLAAALAWRGGTPQAQARALSGLGVLALSQGDLEEAASSYEQSLAIFRARGDRAGESSSLNNLGAVRYRQNDLGAARACHEQSLPIFREVGNRNGEAGGLDNLGMLAQVRGDLEEAASYYAQALAIMREIGNQGGEANVLNHLGNVRYSQGDWAGAEAYYAQTLAICRETGSRVHEAGAINNLGGVKTAQGDWPAARALYEEALTVSHEIGDQGSVADTTHSLGIVAREQGRLAESGALFTRSLTLRRQLGSLGCTLETLEEWAALALVVGDAPRAAHLMGAADAGREATSMPPSPEQGDTRARTLAAALAALGESAFTSAWGAGHALPLEAAVEYALGDRD